MVLRLNALTVCSFYCIFVHVFFSFYIIVRFVSLCFCFKRFFFASQSLSLTRSLPLEFVDDTTFSVFLLILLLVLFFNCLIIFVLLDKYNIVTVFFDSFKKFYFLPCVIPFSWILRYCPYYLLPFLHATYLILLLLSSTASKKSIFCLMILFLLGSYDTNRTPFFHFVLPPRLRKGTLVLIAANTPTARYSIWQWIYCRHTIDVRLPAFLVVLSDIPFSFNTIAPPALSECVSTSFGLIPWLGKCNCTTASLMVCLVSLGVTWNHSSSSDQYSHSS